MFPTWRVSGSSWSEMYVPCSLATPITSLSLFQVNLMCSSLTDQVRSIAVVTTAVARGDLTQKIEIQVEGEMSTLKSMSLFPPATSFLIFSRYRQFHG